MECTRCQNEVTYPHVVTIDSRIHEICDDCYEKVCAEHEAECAAQELARTWEIQKDTRECWLDETKESV